MRIREAEETDADAMSRILEEIVAATGRARSTDPDFVRRQYLQHPDRIRCSLAVDDSGEVLGFQSLKRAAAGNPYDLPVGWGIIGTQISPRAARRGVGAALFAASRQAAEAAGLPCIDATIGAGNAPALAYYEAMGFREYRRFGEVIGKLYRLE